MALNATPDSKSESQEPKSNMLPDRADSIAARFKKLKNPLIVGRLLFGIGSAISTDVVHHPDLEEFFKNMRTSQTQEWRRSSSIASRDAIRAGRERIADGFADRLKEPHAALLRASDRIMEGLRKEYKASDGASGETMEQRFAGVKTRVNAFIMANFLHPGSAVTAQAKQDEKFRSDIIKVCPELSILDKDMQLNTFFTGEQERLTQIKAEKTYGPAAVRANYELFEDAMYRLYRTPEYAAVQNVFGEQSPYALLELFLNKNFDPERNEKDREVITALDALSMDDIVNSLEPKAFAQEMPV